MFLNDRLLSELGLSAGAFRGLQGLREAQVPRALMLLQESVKTAWKRRAFDLHPDRCREADAEERYKELGAYVRTLLALTPGDVPLEYPEPSEAPGEASTLEDGAYVEVAETANGRLQVVFKV